MICYTTPSSECSLLGEGGVNGEVVFLHKEGSYVVVVEEQVTFVSQCHFSVLSIIREDLPTHVEWVL